MKKNNKIVLSLTFFIMLNLFINLSNFSFGQSINTADLYSNNSNTIDTDEYNKFPVPLAYSSNIYMNDDIRYLSNNDNAVTSLSTGGSIYIHFDRLIKISDYSTMYSLIDAVKLYKLPRHYAAEYDRLGNIYGEKTIYNLYDFGNNGKKVFPSDNRLVDADIEKITYNITENNNEFDIDKFRILEDLNYLDLGKEPIFMKEIPIANIRVINENILKITPEYDFEGLNKYGLWIDKRAIEDFNGYNMESNLKLKFWVGKDNKNTIANWVSPAETTAISIYQNTQVPYKGYTLYGTSQYGPNNPIVLDLDEEVIPIAQDDILEQVPYQTRNTRRISFDSLQNIKLTDDYSPASTNIEINKFEFLYYFENGTKKTRIYLYPTETLSKGKYYQLIVPDGTLETRSGNGVKMLKINFAIEGKWEEDRETYFDSNIDGKFMDVNPKDGYIIKSIKENYNPLTPLTIDFNSSVISAIDVYFNNIKADNAVVVSKNQLQIYLPSGENKLGPGWYNITVLNSTKNQALKYGVLNIMF